MTSIELKEQLESASNELIALLHEQRRESNLALLRAECEIRELRAECEQLRSARGAK